MTTHSTKHQKHMTPSKVSDPEAPPEVPAVAVTMPFTPAPAPNPTIPVMVDPGLKPRAVVSVQVAPGEFRYGVVVETYPDRPGLADVYVVRERNGLTTEQIEHAMQRKTSPAVMRLLTKGDKPGQWTDAQKD